MAKGYELEVENLTLNDFRNAMRYYGYTGVTSDIYDVEWRLENMFMECQGNLAAFHSSRKKFQDRPF